MKSLKGHLLIASPSLLDPNFIRTVVLMFEHTEKGAGGVILNRPTDKTIADIARVAFEFDSDWRKPIHFGGPVLGPLSAAHTLADLSDLEILPGLYGTFDQAKLVALIEQSVEPSFFVVNYAGWGPGQLEGELAEDAWKVLPARPDHVFWKDNRDLWKATMGEVFSGIIAAALGLRTPLPDPKLN
jgi:putative transcriptional regulator